MCGLTINIATFTHHLKRVDFNSIVDHLALTHIIRSKAEPTTTKIKRLLEVLSSYSFNLYYLKYMILGDFLSRQNMAIVIHMRLYLYCLICKTCYVLDIITQMRKNEGKI